MTVDIAVIDYGMGNLHSVAKALEHVAKGARVAVTDDAKTILAAGRVVFPGQGAAPDCMREIDARGLREVVKQAASEKPFLGICMGLQVLFEHSDEGDTPCLGIFPGQVKRFVQARMTDAQGRRLKVPHMGWNNVRQPRPHPLWAGIPDGERFYFVHSYFVVPAQADLVAGYADYPAEFVCACARDNLFAVQFHPEKSASAGLRLLANFVSWNGKPA
ncbi:MAG: imidazole glycerol phosphate synthase subunit HisH [Hydrogenophilales bacterium CG03_land_8_20_14_0_80_62_28]|nr:imidazole glycerol phosphate synthase subunit HisH [Betaproteobacteria bacterium]OIO77166.1 MAG: imidazole glycerol phosphate synthase subunit HisH [Hydrogenophilaceae bacterium CG1_02_62_390]PIV22551.1 MAG: imidazole glycerol phosphate synthase subunit HisH [Hydrogenophilales bacterium CG03_land_8_20_14_0_80_62_28]PIW39328.1 MAG: imidazole glycerol phosphate synthase subunit HisH [Hydrogenophilales bacterium CG15_BIG_FIL_POST_REV_8_21_14_020_62_31]PIW72157.1 MAG: imidazole glycerol phosphat